jgi:5-methylcytosine-specific restriction endonuclease McrA
MNDVRPPSPAEQIRFLREFQRLLDEGSFVATYKFALLHAIADLCVLKGDDSGAALHLDTLEIADQFVRLYWRQVVPFVAETEELGVLRQNMGRQASVVREVAEAHERYDGSLARLEGDTPEWSRLLRSVKETVERMPLWRLQTVGADRLEFLYTNLDAGDRIRLQPGVAYCFREFYPMLTDMIEGAWSDFVQRHNARLLRQVVDLRSFMFGEDRTSLAAPRAALMDLQEGRCFYCAQSMHRVDVDHFIPWRRYPLDLGHNYVLTHASCNGKKSDVLAAEEHLQRWVERNRTLDTQLRSAFDGLAIPHDLSATLRVATWAYGQVHKAGGQVWVRDRELRTLGGGWESLLL